jgi:hypothetical protein
MHLQQKAKSSLRVPRAFSVDVLVPLMVLLFAPIAQDSRKQQKLWITIQVTKKLMA